MTKEQVYVCILNNQEALEDAIVTVDDRQTADEQAAGQTHHLNGRGWNGWDAEFGSSLAKQIRRSVKPPGQRLTEKQVAAARKFMKKYCGQVADLPNRAA